MYLLPGPRFIRPYFIVFFELGSALESSFVCPRPGYGLESLTDCSEVDELFLVRSSARPFDEDALRGRAGKLFDDPPRFELVDGDLDVDFLGTGRASSGV